MNAKTIKLILPEDFPKIPAAAKELQVAVINDLLAIFDRCEKVAKSMKPGTSRVLHTHPIKITMRKTA